jgi:hypothetical protein
MRPGTMGSPCSACAACSGPRRDRISGSVLAKAGCTCRTMNTAAGKSAGRAATSWPSAWMPPADAPTTMMSRRGEPRSGAARGSSRDDPGGMVVVKLLTVRAGGRKPVVMLRLSHALLRHLNPPLNESERPASGKKCSSSASRVPLCKLMRSKAQPADQQGLVSISDSHRRCRCQSRCQWPKS